jgi:isocitrate dehydrogenase kinase/phosphatase
MTSLDQLLEAYAQWRECSEAEGAAIERADWPAVTLCQHSKLDLREAIIRNTACARETWTSTGGSAAEFEARVRSVVGTLIELERRNEQALAKQRQSCQARREELEASSRNLRRLRTSYQSVPAAHWQSWS